MRKGRALLSVGEYERAEKTFQKVAKRSTNMEDEGAARLAEGDVHYSLGEVDRAREIYAVIIEKMPLSEPAANAQLAIARTWDDVGDLERAHEEYERVREQGSGFEASRTASQRMTEIQSVIDLRLAIDNDDDDDRERKRYLLAEQLLEEIGNVDAALAEYSSLAEDAIGTEWGAKALYAEAWVLEHRLDEPDSAEALLHRLANYHSGTEADAYARRRLGYPVWTVEKLDAPPVHFIRPNMDTEPEEIVLSRVDPRDVPLPPGVAEVEVWIRLTIADDGSVEKTKIVRSGGNEFDAAVIEAVQASKFLSPTAGGPRITVARYVFPPPPEEGAVEEVPEAPPEPSTVEGSIEGLKATIPDSLVAPDGFLGEPDAMTLPTENEPIAPDSTERIDNPTLRGKNFDPSTPD
jgi:TonB family protein